MTGASSLAAACHEAWTAFRDRPALCSDDDGLSYGELADRVSAAAARFRAAGVRRGDLVAIAMERSLDAVVTVFGIVWAGGCPCPMEPRLSAEETDLRFASVGIDRVVHDAAHAAHVGALRIPADRRIPADGGDEGRFRDDGLGEGDRALLLFTSGSTGRPKGVLLSHGNLLGNAAGVIAHTGLGPQDRLLHVMPIHHTNGLNNQLFAPLLVGAMVVFAPAFKADAMPALIARHRPTIITGVPTMYSRMLGQVFEPEALGGLRMARCGSAPITEELHRKVEAKLGCPLVISYGLSEATCTSLMNPPDARRLGTVGTVLHGQTVKLLHPGDTEEVRQGGEGEIAIAGPSLMLGYLGGDAEASRAVADGWLRTGDLGRFDPDGYLAVTGRLKEVIIRGGENLSPLAIEQVVVSDPAVAACCVVGRPDADLGEVPVAFVVPAPGASPDPERVQDLVARRLSRIYRPVAVHLVDGLPETSIGKVDRKALAARVRLDPDGAAPTAGRGRTNG